MPLTTSALDVPLGHGFDATLFRLPAHTGVCAARRRKDAGGGGRRGQAWSMGGGSVGVAAAEGELAARRIRAAARRRARRRVASSSAVCSIARRARQCSVFFLPAPRRGSPALVALLAPAMGVSPHAHAPICPASSRRVSAATRRPRVARREPACARPAARRLGARRARCDARAVDRLERLALRGAARPARADRGATSSRARAQRPRRAAPQRGTSRPGGRAAPAALAIFRELGDRRGEAPTLNSLALALEAAGDTDAAVERFEQALTILRDEATSATRAG